MFSAFLPDSFYDHSDQTMRHAFIMHLPRSHFAIPGLEILRLTLGFLLCYASFLVSTLVKLCPESVKEEHWKKKQWSEEGRRSRILPPASSVGASAADEMFDSVFMFMT